MTRIDFYKPVPDKLGLAVKLLKKALAQHTRVLIWANDAAAAKNLDADLWAKEPAGFLPHCDINDPLASATPIHIAHAAQTLPDALPHHDLILNFADTPPAPFARFDRLIELIGVDEADILRCRDRYRFYKDRGYPLTVHDLDAPR